MQPAMSSEERRLFELVSNSEKQVEGHYQITLPLRNLNLSMPNNTKKQIFEQRLCYLKRRFSEGLNSL